MKQSLTAALLCLFVFYTSFAQTTSSEGAINGIVIDSASRTRLSHVSVEVMETGNEEVVKSTLTNKNGMFTFTGLSFPKSYHIKLSYTGFRTAFIPLPILSATPTHLGDLPLVSVAEQLQEVNITAQKPVLLQDINKILYNVDADPESKTASALDILSKIPMLTVDAEDNLQMNGHSNYRVLINGKPSTLFRGNPGEMFKNLPASMIKSVEVINSPSAKYEAAGIGGIINIITYKKITGGFNGGVNLRASSPKGFSSNGNLTAKAGKLSFSGNFGRASRFSPGSRMTYAREDKLRRNRVSQQGSHESEGRTYNGGGEISLEWKEQNTITANYSRNSSKGSSENSQLAALLDSARNPKERYRRLNTGVNNSQGNDFSFDFQHNAKKNVGQQLTLSYIYSQSESNSSSDFLLMPLLNYKNQSSTTKNKDVLEEQTIKGDYAHPIKEHVLELGVSTIKRRSNSHYFYKTLDTTTGALVLDTAQSNSFTYQEAIHSGYASFHLRMHLWGLQAGARLERAELDAQFISSGTLAKQTYVNLVPTVTLSRRLKGVSSLKLSYTQRIQRPDLYYLDPYVDMTDPYNISYGNPSLQPAMAHVFSLAYTTLIQKTSISINTLHQFTNNSIQQFTTLGADTVASTTFGNIGRNRNTSFSLGINTALFKKVNINLNSNANYQEYNSMINGKPHNNKGLTYSISGGFNLRLKTWRIGSNLSYNAPNILTQGRTSGYASNSATLNKYFLKNNKANIGLSVTSLFQEHRRIVTEIDDPAFYLRRESISVIRRYNLALNYRFAKIQGSTADR